MKGIPSGSVDMVLCDLPYGTTQNKWDSVIAFEPLWEQYRRVCKPNAAIVLTAAQPFTSALVMSNVREFKYEWVWEKDNGTGFLNAKKQPLRSHESILVFYREQSVYYPQMEPGKPYTCKQGGHGSNYNGPSKEVNITVNNGERYPKTILRLARDKGKEHPTQKPVALFEYLIKTYTNPGETVLDNCCGSGTAGVAAANTGRNSIQIELSEEYCVIARRRLEESLHSLALPEAA
jgi:site-specific DNA-methyltransferase (adenine-specific)